MYILHIALYCSSGAIMKLTWLSTWGQGSDLKMALMVALCSERVGLLVRCLVALEYLCMYCHYIWFRHNAVVKLLVSLQFFVIFPSGVKKGVDSDSCRICSQYLHSFYNPFTRFTVRYMCLLYSKMTEFNLNASMRSLDLKVNFFQTIPLGAIPTNKSASSRFECCLHVVFLGVQNTGMPFTSHDNELLDIVCLALRHSVSCDINMSSSC